MATNAELVDAAMRFFFDVALPEATGKHLGDVADPKVHVGSYSRWAGGAVQTAAGQQITPQFALHVGPELALSGNTAPQGAAATIPAGAPVQHLTWIRNAADAQVDDAAEIQRIMADVDSFANLFGTAASAEAGPAPGGAASATQTASNQASEWAQAIVAARASLGNAAQLSEVPEPLRTVASDLPGLREVLQRFFTYTPDGAHYSRWAGAGRDALNPAHLHADYKRHNVQEILLRREEVYLYAVVPESLLASSEELGGGVFREIVVLFTPAADNTFALSTVHTARWRRAGGPHSDFVFFYTEQGTGLQVARATQEFLSSGTSQAMLALQGATDPAAALDGITPVTTPPDGSPLVHLVVQLQGEPSFPPGVTASGEGDVRVVLTPPDQIAAVAALPEVQHVAVLTPPSLSNDLAATAVHAQALAAKLPDVNKGGNGVLVGVIDTGVDGKHEAFAGRIHAVWDQGTPQSTSQPAASRKTPSQHNPTNHAYDAFNWGVELTGTDVSFSGDPDGHGTHVCGTAAGEEVKNAAGSVVLMPAGVAPRARLAVVRAIAAGASGDPTLGARWIFQKASELNVPCVINMSYGHHVHGHDGTSADAQTYFAEMRSGNAYKPGRIMVAAAGNDRRWPIHVARILPSGPIYRLSRVRFRGFRGPPDPPAEKWIDVWVRNPGGTGSFPLDLWVYRAPATPGGLVTESSNRVRVGDSPYTATFTTSQTSVTISTKRASALNGDHNFRIYFASTGTTDMKAPNSWGIAMRNQSGQNLEVHAWIDGGHVWDSEFDDTVPSDVHVLTGSPGSTPATVSVAASVARNSYNDIDTTARPGGTLETVGGLAPFTSPGPLRQCSKTLSSLFAGITHPINAVDVTAPGFLLHSALSTQVATDAWMAVPDNRKWVVNNVSRMMSGTSMASPVVTGIVANLLSAETQLTLPQVLDRLRDASGIPGQPVPARGSARPAHDDWGWGLLDAGSLRP